MRAVAVLSIWLPFALSPAVADGGQSRGPPPTAAQKQQLQERDRLSTESLALEREGKLTEAVAAAQKMLAIERAVFGNVHADVAASLQRLARLHETREDFASAEKLRVELVALQSKLRGDKAWQVTDARLDLEHVKALAKLDAKARQELKEADQWMAKAVANNKSGKYEEGAQAAENALALRVRVLGEHSPLSATAANWAGVLWDRGGQLQKARPHYEQALAIRKKISGDDHPDTALALHNLGAALSNLGDNADARLHYQQALAIRKKLLGEKHADTITTAKGLRSVFSRESSALEKEGKLPQAIAATEKALAVERAALGDVHADVVRSLQRLARLHESLEEFTAAEKLRQEVVQLQAKLHGQKSWQAGDARLDLQHLETLAKLDAKARQELKEADRLMIVASGNGNKPGKYLEGAQAAQKALAIRVRLLGEENSLSAASANWAGILWHRGGQPKKGRPYYEQAVAIRKKILGDDHPETARALNNLGAGLAGLGEDAGARSCYEQALAIYTKVLGDNSKDAAYPLNNLGTLLYRQKDYAGARPNLQQALAIRKKYLGARHADTIATAKSLRNVFSNESTASEKGGKVKEAVEAAEKMLAIEREFLEGLDVINSLKRLARLYERQEDFTSAKKRREEVLALQSKLPGGKAWQVVDARLELQQLATLAKLDAKARQELKEADEWMAKVGPIATPGNYDEAAQAAEKALAIRVRVLGEENRLSAFSARYVGIMWVRAGHSKKACPFYERALASYQKILGDNHPDTAQTLNNFGAALANLRDFANARGYYEQALVIRKKVLGNNHVDTAASLSSLGALLYMQEDFAGARSYYEQALAIQKNILGDNHPDTARTFNRLGHLLYRQADYGGAKSYFEQSLATLKERLGENHPDTATLMSNLGRFLVNQGDYTGARTWLEKALAIRKKVLGDKHSDTASSLHDLGLLLRHQGDYPGARAYYEQALAIRRVRGENRVDTAQTLNNLGVLLAVQGDFEDRLEIRDSLYAAARSYHEQALAIRLKVLGENHSTTAMSLNNLGDMLSRQGDYAEAQDYLEQALAIRREILGDEHPEIAYSLTSLGKLLTKREDYPAAKSYYEEALAVRGKGLGDRHPETASALSSLGYVLFKQGDYQAARSYMLRSLAISKENLNLASESQAERQQLAMTKTLRSQLDNYVSMAWEALFPADEVYSHVYGWKGAVTARQRALKQAQFEPGLAPLAKKLHDTAVELQNVVFTAPDSAEEREGWVKHLETLTHQRENLERQLAAHSKSYHGALQEPGVDELSKVLPADVALVDFLQYRPRALAKQTRDLAHEQRVIAFIIRPNRPVAWVELGPMAPIEAAITEWRKQVQARQTPTAVGTQLRQMLWEPLEAHLQGAKTVLLAPDGALNQLPFAALPGKQAGKYLLEERSLAVIPLPRWLPQMLETPNAAKPAAAPSLLVLGDVEYGAAAGSAVDKEKLALAPRGGLFKDWAPLKASSGEILAIAKTFLKRFGKQSTVTTLSDDEATERAFRQESIKHQILHLATHGFFAPAEIKSVLASAARGGGDEAGGNIDQDSISGFNPGLLSGLVLAGANKPPAPGQDDGILTAVEVANLDLRKVELVVLSACETGLGQVAGGEGVLGLQRAFQVAGARTTITSLWKVPDRETRDLMEGFYQGLWDKKSPLSKLEALRQAQLRMLREGPGRGADVQEAPGAPRTSPPFYWAAFVLSGDWR